MISPNQRILDAQIDRQEGHKSRAAEVSATVVAILDESEARLRVILERYLSELGRPEVDLSSAAVRSRLDEMRRDVLILRATALDAVDGRLREELTSDVRSEWDFLLGLYASVLSISLRRPDASSIPRILDAQFLGRDIQTWLTDLAVSDSNRISDQVTIGLIQRRTRVEILSSVVGDQGLDGGNGATQVTRNSLAGVVVGGFFAALALAKKSLVAEGSNNELLPRELYVAVLDSRTTQVCRSLNGKVFPVGSGPYPPLHWNCRSTRVPLPDEGDVPELP